MIALALVVVAGAGAFVAIVLAQAALNRRITGSERRGGWAGPIARALLAGTAYEVGAPWKAIAIVVALIVGAVYVVPGLVDGPDATAAEDCRQVMVLTPDHPAGVLVERCGPSPVAEVVYPSGEPATGTDVPPPTREFVARELVPVPEPERPAPAGPPTVRLAPGEVVVASGAGVMIGNGQHWSRTDAAGVVVACAGQGCSTYPTGYRVTR